MDRNTSLIQGNRWWNKPCIPVWLFRTQGEPILSKNKSSGESSFTHNAAEWLAGWLLVWVSLIWPFSKCNMVYIPWHMNAKLPSGPTQETVELAAWHWSSWEGRLVSCALTCLTFGILREELINKPPTTTCHQRWHAAVTAFIAIQLNLHCSGILAGHLAMSSYLLIFIFLRLELGTLVPASVTFWSQLRGSDHSQLAEGDLTLMSGFICTESASHFGCVVRETNSRLPLPRTNTCRPCLEWIQHTLTERNGLHAPQCGIFWVQKKKRLFRDGKMAQQVRHLPPSLTTWVQSWEPRGGRRGLTPTCCPLTSTCIDHPHTCTCAHKVTWNK